MRLTVAIDRNGPELEDLWLDSDNALDAVEQIYHIVSERCSHDFPLAEIDLGAHCILGVAVDVLGDVSESRAQRVGEHEHADGEHHPERYR